jgi:hypothetical protein
VEDLQRRLSQPPRLPELSAVAEPQADFVLLRRCLREQGFGPRVWDLLPETQLAGPSSTLDQAVRAFQGSRGLAVDGVVGPRTWAALAAEDASPPAIDSGPTRLRAEVVRQALACVGIREQGSNRGPAVEQIQREGGGRPGDAWCAEFCAAMLGRACRELGVPVPFRISPNVDRIGVEAQAAGRLNDAAQAAPGDLLLLGRAAGGRPDYFHVGIVESSPGGGVLHTIEGNTNDNGSANGNGVYRKVRSIQPAFRAVRIADA